jgi:hypothetical protein
MKSDQAQRHQSVAPRARSAWQSQAQRTTITGHSGADPPRVAAQRRQLADAFGMKPTNWGLTAVQTPVAAGMPFSTIAGLPAGGISHILTIRVLFPEVCWLAVSGQRSRRTHVVYAKSGKLAAIHEASPGE